MSGTSKKDGLWRRIKRDIQAYFFGGDPTLAYATVPMCFLAMLLFTRHPSKTNFIFDEQEALLANPYVRSIATKPPSMLWRAAFTTDFWGRAPDRSIGSYRPIPNLIWRALWGLGFRDHTPFFHHFINVIIHGMNAAIITALVFRFTRDRLTAWLAGALFATCAVLTEAVSGVVGLSDVLGGLGALLALWALVLPVYSMPLAVFGATLLGLYSKESAMCIVPLVPLAALLVANATHPAKPMRFLRGLLAFIAAAGAFVLYVETRRRWFPAPLPKEFLAATVADKPLPTRTFAAVMRWFAQPSLPKDPLNNPLAETTPALRVSGALRVYLRGLGQVVFPMNLSGDYSAPQEPVPAHVVNPESVLGFLAMFIPIPLAFVMGVRGVQTTARRFESWLRERLRLERYADQRGPSTHFQPIEHRPLPAPDSRTLAAIGLLWIVVSYFPVSNIPVVLPTVRAERFWYFPAMGTSMVLALILRELWREAAFTKLLRRASLMFMGTFFLFQGVAARTHANDYTDDLAFWDATRKAVPNSAKAHLNYSVMKGARNDLETRRRANIEALKLAPEWPMANVYLGDTLCRMHRVPEAWPHYKRGFELDPNSQSLVSLALQCLWDEKAFETNAPNPEIKSTLVDMGKANPGSWLEYLVNDTVANGETNKGVAPKYRPRGYNEGPKD